jgi:methylase of polypeptide subunit release factors
VAGPLGTEVHSRLMEQAADRLVEGGYLLMEGGEHQVAVLAESAGELGYSRTEIIEDFNSLPRIVKMGK